MVYEVKVVHTGYPGSPGYSQHYFDDSADPQACVDATHEFWDAVAPDFVTAWRYSIQPDVPLLDTATGVLQSTAATVPATQGIFGGAGNYAGGVGAAVAWITATTVGTRILRGRTFLVPLHSDAYDSDGTLNGITLNRFREAAMDFAGHGLMVVWHRPVAGAGGQFGPVVTGTCRDSVAWLSSRRS